MSASNLNEPVHGQHDHDGSSEATVRAMAHPTSLDNRSMWVSEGGGQALSELPKPGALEVFRELRTELLRLSAGKPFSLTITGTQRGAGTTHVATHLAQAIARDHRRQAILIDCNLSHPTLSQAGSVDHAGLTDLLGSGDGTTSLEDVVQQTAWPRLGLIGVGRGYEQDPECLYSPEFSRLLASLHDRYDNAHLILDCAAMDRSADARQMADVTDMVSLVVPYGRVMASQLAQYARAFTKDQFAGAVFNRLPQLSGL